MADLDDLTVGLVIDMLTEKINDSCEYDDGVRTASQGDFDRF
jgi:hypothetical protein